MTSNYPNRNHWKWGTSAKSKRTNSINSVRISSGGFPWCLIYGKGNSACAFCFTYVALLVLQIVSECPD